MANLSPERLGQGLATSEIAAGIYCIALISYFNVRCIRTGCKM